MRHRVYLLLMLLMLLILACNKASKHELDNIVSVWMGKEVILPGLNKFNIQNSNPSGLKIVTRINGNCYSCLMQLKEWQIIKEDISQTVSIPFYFYIVVSDSTMYKILNKQEIHFNYPVIFDPFDEFRKLNRLEDNSIFHSMLLDSNNRILLIGNPVNNMKMQNLYKNIIVKKND